MMERLSPDVLPPSDSTEGDDLLNMNPIHKSAVAALWNFFDRMAEWEAEASRFWQAENVMENPDAQTDSIRVRLSALFDELSVAESEDRLRVELIEHSEPPEYERERWHVVSVEESPSMNELWITVRDRQPQSAEIIRFTMRLVDDKWKVKSRAAVRGSEIAMIEL